MNQQEDDDSSLIPVPDLYRPHPRKWIVEWRSRTNYGRFRLGVKAVSYLALVVFSLPVYAWTLLLWGCLLTAGAVAWLVVEGAARSLDKIKNRQPEVYEDAR